MTKKLLSVVALAAIMGTGAQAYDAKTAIAGKAQVVNRVAAAGTYTGLVQQSKVASEALALSVNSGTLHTDRLKGDALIFPALQMSDGWESEFVFRNNHHDKAVVAKVVLYSADDSSEVLDFNAYLSAKDQVRFTAKKSHVYISDDSVVASESWAESDPTKIKFADEITIDHAVRKQDGSDVKAGYVIVYAMTQTIDANNTYHHNHAGLWKEYRNNLDALRPGWMDESALSEGVYTKKLVDLPNVDANSTSVFENPDESTLSGTARIYNATGELRDILLPTTALANFTESTNDDALMLWAPGEYAAIGDRCLESNGTAGLYDVACLVADTVTFEVNATTYTYENAIANAASTVANQLVITQPTKRLLVQVGQGITYWATEGCDQTADANSKVATGRTWGFVGALDILDEEENGPVSDPSDPNYDPIFSPAGFDPDITVETAYCKEVVRAENIEKAWSEAETRNGYVKMNFKQGGSATVPHTIPAIVTQMTATRVNGDAFTNWVYSPADK